MRSSASADNCINASSGITDAFSSGASNVQHGTKENFVYNQECVVMRPTSARHCEGPDVKVRPRSADVQSGNQIKRNSRTLMQVELPSLPSDAELSFIARNSIDNAHSRALVSTK